MRYKRNEKGEIIHSLQKTGNEEKVANISGNRGLSSEKENSGGQGNYGGNGNREEMGELGGEGRGFLQHFHYVSGNEGGGKKGGDLLFVPSEEEEEGAVGRWVEQPFITTIPGSGNRI